MSRIPTKRTIILSGSILAVFLLGLILGGGNGAPPDGAVVQAPSATAQPEIWTCSMHPQIKLPSPGQCPICFMDLIPLESAAGDEQGPRTLVMSEAAAARAEIQTATVERRSVSADVRLIGTVVYDETRLRTVSARVPGRIDKLLVNATGSEVRRGENLVTLYSPQLYSAQTELLNAIDADRGSAPSGSALMRETSAATVEAARRRLELWGLGENQIKRIEAGGEASFRLDIPSPVGGVVVHMNAVEGMYVSEGTTLYTVADLSVVWIDLEAYESDLARLDVGQEVRFTAEAWPGRTMSGRVVFIDPVLSPTKRTAGLRVEADNRDGRLKPGMFVNATVAAGSGRDGASLVIPATAPLITGERAVVYVRLPGGDRPAFEGREVALGPRMGNYYVVAGGLAEGESVVVKGNFKIDSALQIQAKPSMMNPAGGGPVPGHDHGGGAAPMARAVVPAAFRAQLDLVLGAYLDAQAALATDDLEAAGKAAGALRQALAGVDMTLLKGGDHAAWMENSGTLTPAAAAFAQAPDLKGLRAAFIGLSEALWRTLEVFGPGGSEPVRRFNCPMANGNAGADWLQMGKETANPYFGASMLRCGSQVDSLTAAVDPEAGR
jgi:Cu(I)/Ag(I) efflux system membrane fusion protein